MQENLLCRYIAFLRKDPKKIESVMLLGQLALGYNYYTQPYQVISKSKI
jgi:hypothetical protein